ncbi:hypothetical protein [Nostoc sp.]|uniref:hypothetical protein n=1 Tax=Nostoc sp. TaxID=1180 RepID=UPI002FFB3262
MSSAINPHQFASLDYADADMYAAIVSKPPTATPLNLPLDLSGKKPSGGISPGEAAFNRDEEARRRSLFNEQREAQAAREAALKEREIARNLALQKTKTPPPEQPTVAARDYEKGFLPQKSTPERQPVPSTGSPPPTPSGTAARASALVEPTATPAPAALKEAIATTAGNAISTLPRALPQAAGRLVIPGVGAALSIGTRLVVGQSVTQAVTSTAAGSIGYGAGFLIGTAIGGPIGGVVGAMVGSTAATLFSDWLFSQNMPSTAEHLQTFTPNYPAFRGGQGEGIEYHWNFATNANPRSGAQLVFGATGPISDFRVDGLINRGSVSDVEYGNYAASFKQGYGPRVTGSAVGFFPNDLPRLVIKRVDGLPDPVDPISPVPPPDNLPYRYNASPVGDDNTVPSGTPAAGLKRGKTRNVAPSMPSNNTPNGAPFFPGHGGLAPSYLPNPEHQPSNLGGMMPLMQPLPQRQSLPFAEPEDIAVPRVSPTSEGISTTTATNPSTFAYPAYVPETAKPVPISDALSPVPKAKSAPSVKTPTELSNDGIKTALDQQKKDFDEQIGRITAIATAIAAITPAIQGLPDAIAKSPTVQAANKETTQGAVCEIAQPGGCLGNALDDSANKVNQNNNQNTANLLDKINAGANAAQLALLELINAKLGAQLVGGIAGKLTRFADWMHLDRVLNIMILATTVHNGLMLSNDIGQTLLGVINNVLTLVGLKKEDGSTFDIGSVISGSIENLIKGAIGTENYQELTTAWQKANRIYQATTNVLNQLMNVNSVITNALEVIGSYTGKIGNALRIWGVIGEKAYSWMNPQPSFDNQWITKLQKLQEGANTVAMVAQIPIDAVNSVTELNNSATEFVKAVKQEPETKSGVDVGEAAKVKAEREAAKTASYVPDFDISDLFDFED